MLPKALLPRVGAVVLTSATLRADGSFRHIRRRLGLDDDSADSLAVDSPFDYARQCLLYVSRDLPDPRSDGAAELQAKRIAELLDITDGRAFVLFTSHRAMHNMAELLGASVDRPMWVQGQAPRSSLLKSFRNQAGGVLLATGSFWEGVDVPGDALSQVIIDRLPFAVPTDPLTAARAKWIDDAGGDAFAELSVPDAVIAFRQGFGRLIRRRSNRGIVSVLDSRLVSKRYGAHSRRACRCAANGFARASAPVVGGSMTAIVIIAVAYLLGSIPFGLLIGKSRGVDVRKAGSGNIGATNVARTVGKKLGIIVLLLDACKGALPIVALLIMDAAGAHVETWWLASAGFAAILGHCFSPWLSFLAAKAWRRRLASSSPPRPLQRFAALRSL